jgi:hypothetical protein
MLWIGTAVTLVTGIVALIGGVVRKQSERAIGNCIYAAR